MCLYLHGEMASSTGFFVHVFDVQTWGKTASEKSLKMFTGSFASLSILMMMAASGSMVLEIRGIAGGHADAI